MHNQQVGQQMAYPPQGYFLIPHTYPQPHYLLHQRQSSVWVNQECWPQEQRGAIPLGQMQMSVNTLICGSYGPFMNQTAAAATNAIVRQQLLPQMMLTMTRGVSQLPPHLAAVIQNPAMVAAYQQAQITASAAAQQAATEGAVLQNILLPAYYHFPPRYVPVMETAGPPPVSQQQLQHPVHIPVQEPFTISMLDDCPPRQQKEILGERLFPLIEEMYPDLAGKITGMLLEINNTELVHMLEHGESLKGKVDEAVLVLQAHESRKS